MAKDYLDNILDDLKKDLQDWSPPEVRYDSHDKKITVKYGFDFGHIEVKLKAPSDWWLIEEDTITFSDIEPYLSRPSKKVREDLQRYAEKWPDDFREDMWTCFHCASFHNPLYHPARKARGGSPYGLDWQDMWKIQTGARELYIYLQYWFTQPVKEYPSEVKKLLQKYRVISQRPKDIVMEIINSLFDGFSIEDPELFYKKYIAHLPLRTIKKSKRITSGNTPFLKKVLS